LAKQVLLNARYFVGPADLTSYNNKIELDDSMEEKETTNFGSGGAKEVMAGIESVAIGAEGQWVAGDPGYIDDEMWAARRVIEAHTICPETAAVAALAYLTKAVRLDSKLFGQVGDVEPWMLAAAGSWPLARGVVLNNPGTALTVTGSGTAVQHIAVSTAAQYLYATLHVLSVSGTATPTLTVKVQSDNAGGFPSATDRITFTAATAQGSQVTRVAGINADDWYRISYTISGTNPSFLAMVAVGVQ
jgi:hypothetical protein